MSTRLKSDKNGPLLVLAEGSDDKFVIIEMLRSRGINLPGTPDMHRIWVEDKVGVDPLLDDLSVRWKGTGVTSLGVVLDADENIDGRWQRITQILIGAGYASVPPTPELQGTILPAEKLLPRLGVWIMPDNSLPGMLEHFVSYLCPPDDLLWPEAKDAVNRIVVAGKQKFVDAHRIKAEARTWLAWQEDPGVGFGVALAKKYLDPHCSEGVAFYDWLKRLFSL